MKGAMPRTRHDGWTAALAAVLLALASSARAEPPPSGAPAPAPSPAPSSAPAPVPPEPTATPVYVEPTAPSQPEPEPAPQPSADEGRGIQYGVYGVVPYFFDGAMSLGPGYGFQFRIGWEFPSGLSFEFGWQIIFASGHTPITREDVDLLSHYTTLGLRYAFLNPSALVPFIGAGAALSYWFFDPAGEGGTGAITVNGAAGFIYEVSAQLGVELGLQLDYTLSGDVGYFQDDYAGPQLWMAPFVGATLYY